MIVIATDDIGGPGKGLFQFLKYTSREDLEYLLCNFELKGRPDGQFIDEARRLGLNLMLLNQRATIDPGLIARARRIIKDHEIDVVQTHGHKPNILGFFLSFIARKPWVAFAHGYIHGSRKTELYNRLDRMVLPWADRVVAVAGSMKTLLLKSGVRRDKIRLIYNAIEPAPPTRTSPAELRQAHGLTTEHVVAGAIGRLSPEKGHLTLFEAMRSVASAVPTARLLVVGDGPDRTMLQEYCRAHGLQDRVIFTGYQENISDYYGILDLLVLPSLTEGLPNTVLEAMSFGIPVLATSVGGVPEIIEGDNGVMVPPQDPAALAQQLIRLLENQELRRTIGANGRNSLYPRFSPERRAREILAVYDELLAPSQATTELRGNV